MFGDYGPLISNLSFAHGVHRFNTLWNERRAAEVTELAVELIPAATTVLERIVMGECLARVGMFEEAERIYDAMWPHLIPEDQWTYDVAGDRAYVKYQLGKLDEGSALDKTLFSRKWNQHPEVLPEPQRDVFRSILREKMLEESDSVKGKRVFLFFVGGLGDAIQHVRHVEQLVEEGADAVYLTSPAPLVELFKNSGLPVRFAHATEANLKEVDFTAMSHALIWRYASSAPFRAGYLKPTRAPSRFPPLFMPKNKKKIGIVWRSMNAQFETCRHEPFRSMELSDLIPIFSLPHTQFYSLNFGSLNKQEKEISAKYRIFDTSSHVRSFADLANVMKHLDLVISIDSAPSHLAGALDIPVWTVLSRVADWRWLGQTVTRTALYPSMRLFRQSTLGDWTPVVAELAANLETAGR